MCGGSGTGGICSPVSPGKGFYTKGKCGNPESGVESEECLCWNADFLPVPYEPLAA